ncbi:MAG TPA: hypothetical protein VM913_07865 [Sphingomicrobium sp.]|nr:hypothetical protein [Sphingomicrobium sp.]
MRLLLLPALLLATPAAAQNADLPPALPPEVASGQIVDQLQPMLRALSRAFLNLPVGEIEAAVENRPVTAHDRNKTVRQATGMSERELDREIAASTGALKAGTQAMARSWPVISRALSQAGQELEKAIANAPSPAYPRR